MKIRIVLADDHRIIRDGLCSLLEKHPNMEVIAEVENGKEAVEVTKQLKPDVTVLDISMPLMNGIEATRKILDHDPTVKVIGLSMHSDPDYIMGMLSAGASGYLLKECAFGELAQAINAVIQNKSYLSPSVTSTVIKSFRENRSKEDSDDTTKLSGREREILQLIAEGHSSKEIGSELNLSTKTINSHRQNIMDKVNCHDVVQLTKYAIRSGITTADI
jgi:two-component system, NarL family, response regulator NreC